MSISSLHPSVIESARAENTPMKLRQIQLVGWVLTAVFCVCAMIGYALYNNAVRTVGLESAPAVFASHEIKNNVLTMDSEIANFLAANPGDNYAAFKRYDKVRQQLSSQLTVAAKNISFGEVEEAPIRAMNTALTQYAISIQAAVDLHEHNDAAFMVRYRDAYKVLREQIIPNAEALGKVNAERLESTYNNQDTWTMITLLGTVISGAALIGWTAYTQLYFRRRFGRHLSHALVAGGALSLLFVIWCTYSFVQEKRHLSTAKVDAYEQVVHTMDARAAAYAAKAAESRWLLDSPMKADHQNTYDGSAADVAKLAPSESSRTWFARFSKIDSQIRALEAANQHDEAVTLSIGNEADQSNWAFSQLDSALSSVQKVNRDTFDEQIAMASSDINFIWEASLALALLKAFLFFAAVRPRQREFHV